MARVPCYMEAVEEEELGQRCLPRKEPTVRGAHQTETIAVPRPWGRTEAAVQDSPSGARKAGRCGQRGRGLSSHRPWEPR